MVGVTDSCDIFVYKCCQNLNSNIVYFHYYGNLQQVTFWMLPKSGTTLFSKNDNFLFSLGLSRIIGVFPSGYFDILSSVILIMWPSFNIHYIFNKLSDLTVIIFKIMTLNSIFACPYKCLLSEINIGLKDLSGG